MGENWDFSFTESIASDWMLKFSPRVGYNLGDFLVYSSAGLGLINRRMRAAFYDSNISEVWAYPGEGARQMGEKNDIATGLILGLGAECRLSKHYGLALDYLYGNFGSTDFPVKDVTHSPGLFYTGTTYPDIFWYRFDLNVQVINLCLNYHY